MDGLDSSDRKLLLSEARLDVGDDRREDESLGNHIGEWKNECTKVEVMYVKREYTEASSVVVGRTSGRPGLFEKNEERDEAKGQD